MFPAARIVLTPKEPIFLPGFRSDCIRFYFKIAKYIIPGLGEGGEWGGRGLGAILVGSRHKAHLSPPTMNLPGTIYIHRRGFPGKVLGCCREQYDRLIGERRLFSSRL